MASTNLGIGLLFIPDTTKTGSGFRVCGEFKSIIMPSNIIWGVGIDFIDFKSIKDKKQEFGDSSNKTTITNYMIDVYGQVGYCFINSNLLIIDCYSILGLNQIFRIHKYKQESESNTDVRLDESKFLYGAGVGLDIFPFKNKAITLDILYLNTRKKRIGSFGFMIGFTWWY